MAKNVVEMHDTWLVINAIVGCTNGCKYCFLQETDDNISKPKYLVSPEEAVKQLLNHKYYCTDIPLCLLSNTDPFLNEKNILYLKKILTNLAINKVSNPIVIITKCLIPDEFINYVTQLRNEGLNIIFYLSYSGLSKKYEPAVKIDDLKSNFIRLHDANIPLVHYYRPFIPENSSKEKIEEILNFVNKYTDISVVSGLKLTDSFIDKIDYWDITKDEREKCLKAADVWPIESYNYFFNGYNGKQNIFKINSCALTQVLKKPNPIFYGTEDCLKSNSCSKEQRKRCASLKIDRTNIEEKLITLLKQIGKYNEMVEIVDEGNYLVVKNASLEVGDLSYLSFVLKTKITIEEKMSTDSYFNSCYTNAKAYVIK